MTGGPEAAARTTRYAALDAAARCPVLIGHTLDDQAETVLLGLGRGSGAAVDRRDPALRPAVVPAAAGAAAPGDRGGVRGTGTHPWRDPHNDDPRFTRVRLRTEVLPLLEEVLGGGVG